MKKVPKPADKHVGNRIRQRRLQLGLSQEKLGGALGITFQQVQKYEKGTNRVGASRLQQVSEALKVPVSFFFEGLPQAGDTAEDFNSYNASQAFLGERNGALIVQAWPKLRPGVRTAIVDLIQAAVGA